MLYEVITRTLHGYIHPPELINPLAVLALGGIAQYDPVSLPLALQAEPEPVPTVSWQRTAVTRDRFSHRLRNELPEEIREGLVVHQFHIHILAGTVTDRAGLDIAFLGKLVV